jgi:Calcium binding
MNIADIPSIPDREKRFEEIAVDCYDEYEVLSAFEVYLTDALRTPFAASWGTPGTAQAEHATVFGVAGTDEREGVRLRVRAGDGDEYEVLADEIWADDADSANATVLDDYRTYVANGGLPFDPYEEE